jgi:hypothetical protein
VAQVQAEKLGDELAGGGHAYSEVVVEQWLEIDFMKCLGRGGYGDVYEVPSFSLPL